MKKQDVTLLVVVAAVFAGFAVVMATPQDDCKNAGGVLKRDRMRLNGVCVAHTASIQSEQAKTGK